MGWAWKPQSKLDDIQLFYELLLLFMLFVILRKQNHLFICSGKECSLFEIPLKSTKLSRLIFRIKFSYLENINQICRTDPPEFVFDP